MFTFIKTILLLQIPPVPSGPGGPLPPGVSLPIDDGIIFLFITAIIFGTYILYRKNKEKEDVNTKSSLN
jgi:hypothetical protein